LVGFWVTRILPVLAILLWIASLYFACQEFGSSLGIADYRTISILLGAYVVLATLVGAPNIYQSLYWQTGMVTYILPLIFMTAYFAWILQFTRGSGSEGIRFSSFVLSALIAFILGGFSETYVSLQTAALIFFILLSGYWFKDAARKTSLGLLGAGLAGSIASMAVIALAPGTSVRIGLFDQGFSVTSLFANTLYDWYIFTARTAKSLPIFFLLAVSLPSLLFITLGGKRIPGKLLPVNKTIVVLVLFPVVIFLLMLSTILPYEYALASYPDGRVLITTQYILIGGMTVWGILLSGLLSHWIARQQSLLPGFRLAAGIMAVIGLSYVSIRSVRTVLAPIQDYRDFAQSWDTRHEYLKSVSPDLDQVVSAASLTHIGGLAEIGSDPFEWVNQCVAWTYDLEGVVAK
jgi:hypothetical protein